MATLLQRSGKTPGYEIQFYRDDRRVTIYLGGRRYSRKTADQLKEIVEALVYFQDNGTLVPDKRVSGWIESASDEIQSKLAKAGLIIVPEPKTAKQLWDSFLEQKESELRKGDIVEATLKTYRDAENRFFAFFERDEQLDDLTKPRMEQWKDFLRTQIPRTRTKTTGFKESTTAGTLSKAKAVFNWAVRIGWISQSPLDGVGRGSFVNSETERFITMDEYFRMLDVCPCQDWRCILALVRIGGLRAPSEVLRLKWSDIAWTIPEPRFQVTSPKTKRYAGKESRTVPLWPLLAEELQKLFFAQPEKTEFVITRYSDPERTNLGTQFARIAKMAGIGEIDRPFDNMRASRSNEVYASDGAICEAAWIGHSMKTAREHYLRVREEDFKRTLSATAGKKEAKTGFPAVENNFPAVFPAEKAGNIRKITEAKGGIVENELS